MQETREIVVTDPARPWDWRLVTVPVVKREPTWWANARALRAQGWSFRRIATAHDVDAKSVRKLCKKVNPLTRSPLSRYTYDGYEKFDARLANTGRIFDKAEKWLTKATTKYRVWRRRWQASAADMLARATHAGFADENDMAALVRPPSSDWSWRPVRGISAALLRGDEKWNNFNTTGANLVAADELAALQATTAAEREAALAECQAAAARIAQRAHDISRGLANGSIRLRESTPRYTCKAR